MALLATFQLWRNSRLKNVETQELRPSLVYEVQAIVTDPQDLLRLGMPVTVKPVESTEAPKSAK